MLPEVVHATGHDVQPAKHLLCTFADIGGNLVRFVNRIDQILVNRDVAQIG